MPHQVEETGKPGFLQTPNEWKSERKDPPIHYPSKRLEENQFQTTPSYANPAAGPLLACDDVPAPDS